MFTKPSYRKRVLIIGWMCFIGQSTAVLVGELPFRVCLFDDEYADMKCSEHTQTPLKSSLPLLD